MSSAVTILDSFLESAYELPKESARKVFKALRNLVNDPRNAGLHVERLSGRGTGLWSVRVDNDYRIILRKSDQGIPTVLFVGKHDRAYRFAEHATKAELIPTAADASVLHQNLAETLNPLEFMRANLVGEGAAASIDLDDLEIIVRTRKYVGLSRILVQEKKPEVRYSFHQIELAINDKVPPAAHRYRAWWANQRGKGSHSQASSWLSVGWRVAAVNLAEQEVRFVKVEKAGQT